MASAADKLLGRRCSNGRGKGASGITIADENCVPPISIPSLDFSCARSLSTCFLTARGRDDMTLVEFVKPRNDD
jgi:hypothetical protein